MENDYYTESGKKREMQARESFKAACTFGAFMVAFLVIHFLIRA